MPIVRLWDLETGNVEREFVAGTLGQALMHALDWNAARSIEGIEPPPDLAVQQWEPTEREWILIDLAQFVRLV